MRPRPISEPDFTTIPMSCMTRIFTGGQKYIPSGCHHRALSTGFALLISLALSSIKALRDLYQTVFFLPYVTNTLAVGMVFMVLFQKTEYTDGLINLMLHWFGAGPVDFISGPYWAKMFVLCFYTIWVVMPFKF